MCSSDLIEGLPAIKGKKSVELVTILVEQHRHDQAAGRAPANYNAVTSKALAELLNSEEPSVRRLVSRMRKKLYRDLVGPR